MSRITEKYRKQISKSLDMDEIGIKVKSQRPKDILNETRSLAPFDYIFKREDDSIYYHLIPKYRRQLHEHIPKNATKSEIDLNCQVDELLRQANFDSELRKQFVESLNKLPANELRDEVIAKASTEDSTLSNNLNVVDKTEKELFGTKLKQRINDTYSAISDRVEARTDKIKAPFIRARDNAITSYHKTTTALSDSGRNVYNNAAPVVDMISEHARNKLSRVQDEFRTRKLTYQNDANFAKALAKGVSFEVLNEGLNNFEYPEIRYAMMNNAESMFNQKTMTPRLAMNIYLAAEPYLDNNNSRLASKFIEAFDKYAVSDDLPKETVEEIKPVDESDIKEATLTGFTDNGETQWGIGDQSISEDEFLDELMAQYDVEMQNADVILSPDVNDDTYFANLSSSFEAELSKEESIGHSLDFLGDLNDQVSQEPMNL